MEIFFVLLHLWVAGICQAKNLPLVMAATEPTAVMEGSEFDKAFAVVNAMFEQVANTPGTGQRPGRDLIWNEQPAPPDPIDWREQPALTISSKEPPTNQHYIKAKDSDFILLDPFDDDDRNAAALSKMLHGSYRNRRRDYEDQVAEPVPLVSPESGEEHDVAATDSKEQDDDPGATEGDGEEDQGEQDDQGEEDEDPADHEPETKDQDDEEEEDEEDGGAPLEGAPVTEDLDDFPPETFMPPTVLGIARHYKVGSSFSVFPVHIPNAPEHIELGSGVPDEDGEEETEDEAPAEDGEAPAEDGEAPEEDGEAPAEEEGEAPAEDGEEGEDLDPNATTSHYFIIEPATSLDDEEETADSSKKGHRVSEHGEDEGDEHEEDGGEHDTHDDESDNEEDAEKIKEGAEKAVSYKGEGGEKKTESLQEAFDQGKHHDDSAAEEDEGEEELDKHGKRKMKKGFHDKFNFDQRVSRHRFYKNRRNKGDWITSGEDEHSFYNKAEGDEAAIFAKFKDSSGDVASDEKEKDGKSNKKKEKWKKSESSAEKEEDSVEK